jgi:hypothetical protein
MFVDAKLGNMRKSVSWTIYPPSTTGGNGNIIIQSAKRICEFDPKTGKGMLSSSKDFPVFVTLQAAAGAKPIDVPQDVIDAAVKNQPQGGEILGGFVTIA